MKAGLFVFSLFHRFGAGLKNLLYGWGWIRPRRAALPVFSVGSLAWGGMGKTPLAMEILKYFIAQGVRPALVTRGYRGAWERKGGILSDGRRPFGDWRQAGDEAYLTARRFPQAGVFVGKHRILSCRQAQAAGFDLAVLDDGFQHRKLRRDLDVVIFDPDEKAALREPLSGLKRANLILLPETSGVEIQIKVSKWSPGAMVLRYSTRPLAFYRINEEGAEEALDLELFRGRRALAFCGIARPERFFVMLEAMGLRLLERMTFPDHHPYPSASWRRVRGRADALKPEAVITTEKDAVKLLNRPDLASGQAGPAKALALYALRVEPVLPPEFFRAIDSALKVAGGGRT